jgi:regulatory Fis family protein
MCTAPAARQAARSISEPSIATPWRLWGSGVREDLYYRLNVVPIRERRPDIAPLAEHFLKAESTHGNAKRLTAAAAALLLEHSWPGSVRELRNVIERACVMARGEAIDASDLDMMLATTGQTLHDSLPTAVAKLEEALIRKTLAACGGNRAEAARRLSIHRHTDEDVSANPTPTVGKADSWRARNRKQFNSFNCLQDGTQRAERSLMGARRPTTRRHTK